MIAASILLQRPDRTERRLAMNYIARRAGERVHHKTLLHLPVNGDESFAAISADALCGGASASWQGWELKSLSEDEAEKIGICLSCKAKRDGTSIVASAWKQKREAAAMLKLQKWNGVKK